MARSDRKPLVLVVDDDADIRALFESVLARDFRVEVAENGWMALQHLMSKTYDVIVLDMAMPEKSGLSVLTDLRNDPRTQNTPVLVVSAVDPNNDLWAGVAHQWDRYLQKPVSITDLTTNVSELAKKKGRKPAAKKASTRAATKPPAARSKATPPKKAAAAKKTPARVKPAAKAPAKRKPSR